MQKECYIDDLKVINKILPDSLLVASGESVDSMEYLSFLVNEVDKYPQIKNGLILIFIEEELKKVEYCDNVSKNIQKYKNNAKENIDSVGVGVIYGLKNIKNEAYALKMIAYYLMLIFGLEE